MLTITNTMTKLVCNMVIELLPGIEIKININPKDFIAQVSEIALESGNYLLNQWTDYMDLEGVDFAPYDDLGYTDLHGQLIYKHGEEYRIRVETRATRWIPENATKEIYVKATQHIFDPLIKAFNSRYKKRLRMKIKPEKRFVLPPKAKKYFENFTFLANKIPFINLIGSGYIVL